AGEPARIGCLQHVLGLAVGANDGARDAVEALVVLPDDEPDGRGVAPPGARDEFGFIRRDLRGGVLDHAGTRFIVDRSWMQPVRKGSRIMRYAARGRIRVGPYSTTNRPNAPDQARPARH